MSLQITDRLIKRSMQLLERPLKLHEMQMLQNPRVCAVCFESDPELLTNCEKCPQSTFCEMHRNDSSHEKNCFKFISVIYSPNAMYKTIPPLIWDIIDDMKLPLQNKVEKLPISMMTFFEKYFSHVPFDNFTTEKRVVFNTYFSNKYSTPLSIIWTMEKLGLDLESMTIHVVGASLSEQIFIDWGIMLHYLPELRQLKLVFIGLELLPPGSAKMQKECKLCKEDERQVIFETHLMEYQKYCSGKNFEKPNMIACFNAGFDAYPTWEKSVGIFNRGQCPLLVTAYSQQEGLEEKKMIDSKFSSAKCVYSDFNPFASFDYRRSTVLHEIAAPNEFITIYESL